MTLQTMTFSLSDDKVELLKHTICKGATNHEFELFIHACKRTGLDPFMKQIYAVKRWDSQAQRETMAIQTAIDGFRLIAERTGMYAPGKESTFEYDENGNIVSATSYIKKMTRDGTWHEVAAKAKWKEYVQTTKDGKVSKFWAKMPEVMLSKCAEALALRKAFPAELSGLYTTEEMAQAETAPESKLEEALTESPKHDLRKEVQRLYDSLNDTQRSRVNVGLMRNQIDLEKATVEQLEFAMHGIKSVIGG